MKITPPFPLNSQRTLLYLLLLGSPLVMADNQSGTDDKSAKQMPEMTVTDKAGSAPVGTNKERYKVPTTTESVTAEKIDTTINAMNAEDTIKYLPSIQVRKRYVGDTNAPVGWRTSGTSLSARGLIYADGIMLSSLLGNNNTNTGSPRWNMVSPNEIERVDVMYGPFSAMYSGNSIGGVVEITTKMPEKFEAGADIKSSWQTYSMYDKAKTYDSQEYSFNLGDRMKDFSWRFDVSHLDSHSQPITYVNPIATPASGISAANRRNTPTVLGAVNNANNFNVPAQVLGEGNLNHTVQDNFKWKLAYDITPTIRASYTLGLWQNDGRAGFNSFLTNATTGLPLDFSPTGFVRAASNGQYYPLAANGFSETRAEQEHWSHGMNIRSNTGGIFDWELSGSVVDYGKDISRVSTQSPALASTNGAGQVTSLTDSGWHTADAKGIWRPDFYGQHEVSFGFHHDYYNLNNPVYNVATDWKGADSSRILNSNSKGKTQTEAYWLQDAWDFHQDWNLTLGGRLESWHAFDGYNASNLGRGTAPANIPLTNTGLREIYQNDKSEFHFSPKIKLTWQPMDNLKIGASVARAFRFPTVTELFQTTTTTVGGIQNIINGNPNLKPEDALSSELATEYTLDQNQYWNRGKLRLSLFQERVNNAIYSQRTNLSNGSIASVVDNVDQTETYGIEFSGEANDVGIQGLDIAGNATWTDSRITKNADADAVARRAGPSASNPNADQPSVGARQPRVPEWRASATISYRPTDKWTNSVSMRYSSYQFSQLNNSDTNGGTYFGNTDFFVVDLHSKYQITKQLAIAAGIDNINNERYWIFHPFPMRTYFAELKFDY